MTESSSTGRHSSVRRALATAVATALVMLTPPAYAQEESSEGGPQLRTPQQALRSALRCYDPVRGAAHNQQPVLLVPGTTQLPEEAWADNYLPALRQRHFNVCTVRLPNRGQTDIQISAEYVVSAVRVMSHRYRSKVDVVGFSQGPLEPRWAVKYWPDVRHKIDDLIGIEAPYQGSAIGNVLCAVRCIPALHQMRIGSRFLETLNTGDETPGSISYTSAYSLTDDVVFPQGGQHGSWQGDGATNVAVQTICPGRFVDHVQATYDAVVYAIVFDALTHPGPADKKRISIATCRDVAMPGVRLDTEVINMLEAYRSGLPQLMGLGVSTTTTEPAIRDYAR